MVPVYSPLVAQREVGGSSKSYCLCARAARCLRRCRAEHSDAAENLTASAENSHSSTAASRQEPAGLLVPLRNFDGTRKLSPRFPFGFLSRCSAPKPIKASLGFFDESYLFCSSLRGDSGGPSVAVWGSAVLPLFLMALAFSVLVRQSPLTLSSLPPRRLLRYVGPGGSWR